MRVPLLIVAVLLIPPIAVAEDSKRLVKGCEVLVQIYDKQGESGLLAGFTTSLSDALRAGYCRGVIDEFVRVNVIGCSRRWRSMADRIATDGRTDPNASVEQLLESSCGR